MHATVSGCGDNLVTDDEAAIDAARRYLSRADYARLAFLPKP